MSYDTLLFLAFVLTVACLILLGIDKLLDDSEDPDDPYDF